MDFENNPIADIEELLDEIEDLVENASSVPFSKKKVIVEDDLLKLVSAIRTNIPGEISQAKRIVKEKQDILTFARREAEDIKARAEQEAQELIQQENITKRANALAAETVSKAQNESREICRATTSYLDRLLMQTDDSICSSLNELRKAKQMLKIESDNSPVAPAKFDEMPQGSDPIGVLSEDIDD